MRADFACGRRFWLGMERLYMNADAEKYVAATFDMMSHCVLGQCHAGKDAPGRAILAQIMRDFANDLESGELSGMTFLRTLNNLNAYSHAMIVELSR